MTSVQQTATDGPLEVLVAVDGQRDRQLLAEALDDYQVSTASPDAPLGRFDCCVVDDRTFPALVEELLGRKAAADPVFLPVLVLASDDASAERLLSDATADAVDDVVVVPTAAEIIQSRISSLLETRTLSLRLDAERAEYHALAESAQDAIVVFDEDNVIRFANRAAETLFGYAPDVLVGTSVTDLLVEEEPDGPLADPAEAVESETEAFETDVITARDADGRHVPVEVSAARFEAGGESRYTAIVRDVTEREARTAELAEERAVLQGIFDASPDVLVTVDADATLNRWNDRLPELTGYTDAELLDMPTESLVPDGQFEDALESLETALHDDTTVRVEMELRCKDGERVPLEVAIAPIRDQKGSEAVVAGRDISEQKARERELERNRDLLARTQAIADVGGFEVDVATGELYWTDQVYEILGVEPGPEPTFEESFDHFHPDDRPRLRAAVDEALHDQEPQDLELRVVRPSGEVRWVRLRGNPRSSTARWCRSAGRFRT
ncbi:PAS domain-containing protein [Halorarius halobius]|uniref:PAS domain-containing protein n=1 Tax=Halorarius halobius TaxID=2962671 RepID=UPI0020CC69F9|nr:PAS domain S-box protein [Halorarius halobius]